MRKPRVAVGRSQVGQHVIIADGSIAEGTGQTAHVRHIGQTTVGVVGKSTGPAKRIPHFADQVGMIEIGEVRKLVRQTIGINHAQEPRAIGIISVILEPAGPALGGDLLGEEDTGVGIAVKTEDFLRARGVKDRIMIIPAIIPIITQAGLGMILQLDSIGLIPANSTPRRI